MKTMIVRSALALPVLAGALWISGAQADDGPETPSATPTATARPTAAPSPTRTPKGKGDEPRNPRGPERSTFSIPLSSVSITVNGQRIPVSGTLSGVALTHEDGAGGLHIRADVNASGLVVTLPSGAVLRGTGTARIVANLRGAKDSASTTNTSATINLVGPNNTAYRLALRLKVTVNANNQVTVAVLSANLTSSTPSATPTPSPTATPTPTSTPTATPTPSPRPTPRPAPNPNRSTFTLPLSNVVVTVNGQTVRLDGTINGVAVTRQDSAGGLHVRAALDVRDLTVTLANGTVLEGVGTANLVANIGARKGAATTGTATTVINLTGPNNTAYQIEARLKVTVNANNEVTVALLSARVLPSISNS